MVVKCEVKFDQNPHGTYFSGQVVSGKVDLILDKPKNVRAIAIIIYGYAKSHWTETNSTGSGNDSKTEDINYSGKEVYISSTSFAVKSNDDNAVELNPGIHTYNFACALPSALPSSFEGTNGHIRYLVKVVLDRPWKFDQTYAVAFTVLKPVDLNYDSPVLRMPHQATEEKQFWCGMCNSDPLAITLNVPQTGYVPGQMIPVQANVNNASNVVIKDVQFGLREIVTYYSQVPRKYEHNEIIYVCKKNFGEIGRHTSRQLTDFLSIPPVPPTSTFFSKIIHIKYELELLAKVSKVHKNITITCPITIGTVPFVEVIQQQPTALFAASQNGTTLPVIQPLKNPSPNPDILPPSYEEAIHMKRTNVSEEDQNAVEASHFVPRYPVYRFSNTPNS